MIGVMNPMDFMTPGFCKKAMLDSAEESETNFLDGLQSVAREIMAES